MTLEHKERGQICKKAKFFKVFFIPTLVGKTKCMRMISILYICEIHAPGVQARGRGQSGHVVNLYSISENLLYSHIHIC